MKTVEFNETGRWAEVNPAEPQFDVDAGEKREVSNELADIIVEANKGKIIPRKKAAPPAADKAAAESTGTDKGKAESGK